MGLSQIDVMKKLKLKSTSIISRWESGQSMPSGKNLLQLENMYRTLIAEMYFDYKRELQSDDISQEEQVVQSEKQKKPKRLDRGP